MMRKIPFLLLLALCLCLCACANADQAKVPAQPATELEIYFGDDNCENILSETVTVPELSPENVMAALLDKGVISESVSVNSFLMDKTGIIRLDLGGNFGSMINAMGTSGEYIMMGSLVNSFLKAYNATGLMLLVDGKTLETGHNIYDYTMEFYQ